MAKIQKRTPSIHDIAREAKVNISTVSRALDPLKSHLISDKMILKVQKTAEKLGYRPNIHAQSLRTGRSNLIGLIVPDIKNPLYAEFAHQLKNELSSYKLNLVIEETNFSITEEVHLLDKMSEMNVDGAILILTSPKMIVKELKAFEEKVKGLVLIDHLPDESFDEVFVNISQGYLNFFQKESLSSSFHQKNYLFLGAKIGNYIHQNASLRADLIKVYPSMKGSFHFVDSDCHPLEAKNILHAYLQQAPLPDCLIVSSDHMLLGAHSALMERGHRIPQDIKVISSDGTYYCDFLFPGITSIKQPVKEIAIRSSAILHQRILHGKTAGRQSFCIEPQIVFKKSTELL